MTRTPTRSSLTWFVMRNFVEGVKVILGMKNSPILQDISRGLDGRRCRSCLTFAEQRKNGIKQIPARKKRDSLQMQEIIERSSMVVEGLVQLASYKLNRTPNLRPSSSEQMDNPGHPKPLNNPSSFMQNSIVVDNPITPSKNPSHELVKPVTSHRPPSRQLSKSARESKVPSSRLGRISSFGSLIAGLGIGSVAEASKRTLGLSSSEKPLFMSEANVSRIVETLCRVRGAALKLGQIISIQDESIVSPEVAAAFERVRQSADFMPTRQMEQVMRREFGNDFRDKLFEEFSDTPFAAASIGQVHEATLKNGNVVAVKIQYPGVAEGIESDIKNLMMIIKVWDILPAGMFVDNLMKTARRELTWEVDYQREAGCQAKFSRLLSPYSEKYRIRVPKVYNDLTTKRVFISELVPGLPIDQMFDRLPQNVKNDLAARLLRLTLQEIFEFKFMQTDPNFSNYFYDVDTDTIYLLDFGAARDYPESFVITYFKLIEAAANQETEAIVKFSKEIGFLTGFESPIMEKAHVEAVQVLGSAFSRRHKSFHFGRQSTTKKIASLVPIMLKHRLTPPPEETYSLHRRMSGMFLLCAKLNADIDCRSIWLDIADSFKKTHSF